MAKTPNNLVATFSIVGFDPNTGELGVATQSKFLGVGAVVPWAEANVGAVATQSLANTAFGPDGLALLREGKTAQEALDTLTKNDPDAAMRQVGSWTSKVTQLRSLARAAMIGLAEKQGRTMRLRVTS